jgi:Na+-translocating ferredoxin:NAD+ oxidoreductase RnfC subunit
MKKVQEYITYLSPEFIYVPFDNIELLHIKKSKLVYNNTFLGTTNDGVKIFSPVSGKIIGVKDMIYNNKNSKALVIENDFIDRREKLNPTRNMSKLKRSEVVESLEKYGLNKKINSKTTLVVNSLYDKNNDLKDMVINYESYEEILEAIDEFMEIFNMKTCYICVDRDDLISISAYEKYINAFLNICLVHSNKKFKDSTCVFYSVEEILAIYKAIHLDYMYDNTIITINNGSPIIVKVKLYTPLCELLRVLKMNIRDSEIFINGEKKENILNFVIDSTVRSVTIKGKRV